MVKNVKPIYLIKEDGYNFAAMDFHSGEVFEIKREDINKFENSIFYIYNLNIYYNFLKSIFFSLGFKQVPFKREKLEENEFMTLRNETDIFSIMTSKIVIKNFSSLLDIDLDKVDSNELVAMRYALEKAFSFGFHGLTLGTSILNKYKYTPTGAKALRFYFNEEYFTDVMKETAKNSYRGGLCIVNDNLKEHKGTSFSLDVNSLYAYVMQNYTLPCKTPKIFNNYEDYLKYPKYKSAILKIFVNSMTLKPGYLKVFGLKQEGDVLLKYNDKIYNEIVYIWDFELELLKKYYDINYEILLVQAYEGKKGLFNEFLEDLRKTKESTDDYVIKRICKMACVIFYGKFATKTNITYMIEEEKGKYKQVNTTTKGIYTTLSSFIAASARCLMIPFIEGFAESFLYADTDSIHIATKKIPQFMQNYMDASEFGKFKLESKNSYFKAIKPKVYIKITSEGEKVIKCSGLPKEFLKDLKDIKEGDKIAIKEWDTSGDYPKLIESTFTI